MLPFAAARGRRIATLVGALAMLASAAVMIGALSTAHADPALSLRLIGNFTRPLYVEDAPGDTSKGLLFVVEEDGTISVLDHNAPVGHYFLDLRDLVETPGEQGLLSVAFPKDYPTTRRFYVYFSNHDGNNEVDEFHVSPTDPTDALEATRRQVIVFQHPFNTNHNGGQLQFGPDGNLWIATGDGGGAGGGDPGENAQNIDVPLGKILRIDPRQAGPDPYSIPSNNPFVGRPGRDEIWSYGFRNPWRFSFGPSKTLLIGDVGQNAWEEVDYTTLSGAKGGNFGWDNYEGTHLFEGPELTDHILPILEYPHDPDIGYCSVTGGYYVRDSSLTALLGRYLYADFCTGELRSFIPDFSGAIDDAPVGLTVSRPTSFGEGSKGRIYVTSRDGPVYRIVSG